MIYVIGVPYFTVVHSTRSVSTCSLKTKRFYSLTYIRTHKRTYTLRERGVEGKGGEGERETRIYEDIVFLAHVHQINTHSSAFPLPCLFFYNAIFSFFLSLCVPLSMSVCCVFRVFLLPSTSSVYVRLFHVFLVRMEIYLFTALLPTGMWMSLGCYLSHTLRAPDKRARYKFLMMCIA